MDDFEEVWTCPILCQSVTRSCPQKLTMKMKYHHHHCLGKRKNWSWSILFLSLSFGSVEKIAMVSCNSTRFHFLVAENTKSATDMKHHLSPTKINECRLTVKSRTSLHPASCYIQQLIQQSLLLLLLYHDVGGCKAYVLTGSIKKKHVAIFILVVVGVFIIIDQQPKDFSK